VIHQIARTLILSSTLLALTHRRRQSCRLSRTLRHLLTAIRDFTFLRSLSVLMLRGLSQATKGRRLVTQGGCKNSIVSRLLRFASFKSTEGVAWIDVFPLYNEWAGPVGTVHVFFVAPGDTLIDQSLAKGKVCNAIAGDRRREAAEPSEGEDRQVADSPAASSISEFARLVALLTNYPDIRKRLQQSQGNLTRAELDHGMTRDAFWSSSVAPSFNNNELSPHLDTRGHIEEADAPKAPLHSRKGEFLKAQFYAVKSHFTVAYRKWHLSGQLQSEAASFLPFLPCRRGTSELSNQGKRIMIVFVALKCGTMYEDVDMLNMTLKMANEGRRYDVGTEDGNGEVVSAITDRTRAKRRSSKRATPNDEEDHLGSYFVSGCEALASSIRESSTARDVTSNAVGCSTNLLSSKAAEAEMVLKQVNQRCETRDCLRRLRIELADEMAKDEPEAFDVDQYKREIFLLEKILVGQWE
jgi:hypothetical protein